MKEPLLAKILRYMLYATAFMPLIIFSQYISPFHFGKVVIFRAIVELMLVLYVLLVWQDSSYRPRTNIIFWTFLAFTLAFTFTTFTSIDRSVSFWGTLERMGGLFSFWHYFIFFVVLTSVLRRAGHWETFLDMMLISSILSALYGFGQKTSISWILGSGGRERIFGTIGNAALFAGYEIINTFLALTLYLRKGNTPSRNALYLTTIGFGSLAIFLTVVRGSLVGFGTAVLVMSLWYYLRTRSPMAKRIFLVMAAGTLLFAAIIMTPIKHNSFFRDSRLLSRLTDTSFDQFTAKTRYWAWQAGLKGWSEGPKTMLVGWGPENFNIPFSKYFNPKFFTGYGAETLFDRAHNMFVEVLVTMGLIGLIAYVSIYYGIFRSLRKIAQVKRADGLAYLIGFSGLTIAYAIHNAFIFDTSANFLAFFSVLGFISFLLISGEQQELKYQPEPHGAGPLRFIAGVILLIGASIVIYRTDILAARANYATTRGIIAGSNSDFNGAIAKYQEAIQYDGAGKYEFRHRYAQYVLEYAADKKLDDKLVAAIKDAIVAVTKNRDEHPHDYLPELYLSRLNIVLGKDDPKSPYNDVALQHSFRALEISPTFMRTFYEIAQGYLNKKDYDDAAKYFERAAELNPDVGLSYWYWGIVEMTSGNTNKGLDLLNMALQKGYAAGESDYLRLADIYVQRKNYPALAQVYEKLIKLNPKNPQYFASLAVVYANLGRIDDALAMARQAAIVDPSFLPQAQQFARQLGRTL